MLPLNVSEKQGLGHGQKELMRGKPAEKRAVGDWQASQRRKEKTLELEQAITKTIPNLIHLDGTSRSA